MNPEARGATEGRTPIDPVDLRLRMRRFATLRAAQNALSPSGLDEEEESVPERQLRAALSSLASRLVERRQRAAPSEEETARDHEDLLGIDRALEQLTESVLARLDDSSMPDLRARILSDWPGMRTETLALLDVCMESEPYPNRYVQMVDFLLTQLCTEKTEAGWIVAVDPPNLSTRVQRRCWATASCDPETEARILERFQVAEEKILGSGKPKQVLREMYQFKQDIAKYFFAAPILRRILNYNLVMRNRFRANREQQRATDAQFALEVGLADSPEADTPRSPGSDGERADSAFQSPGVLAIAEAIGRRLRGQAPAEDAASRIAEALDLSALERSESEVFLQESDDPALRSVRMTVVVSHLADRAEALSEDIAELGIDVVQLPAWALLLSKDLQREIDALVRENAYDGAQRLSRIKARLLYIRDESSSREGETPTAAVLPVAPDPSEIPAPPRRRERRAQSRRDRAEPRGQTEPPTPSQRRVILGTALGLTCVLALPLLFAKLTKDEAAPARTVQVESQTAPKRVLAAREAAAVANARPRIEQIDLEPAVLFKGAEVRALVEAADDDGDPVWFRYAWTIAGRPAAGGAELMLDHAAKGDRLELTVVANDGVEESEPVTVSTTIENAPPRLVRVELNPSSELIAGVPIVARPQASDADGDRIDFEYQWSVNGRSRGEESARFDTTGLRRGDTVSLRIIATDGEDESEPYELPPLDVANSPPRIVSSPGSSSSDGVFDYRVAAEDADGDRQLQFHLEQAPEGMQIDSLSGAIHWVPRPGQEGAHPVTVIADDLRGGQGRQRFEVSVAGASPASLAEEALR